MNTRNRTQKILPFVAVAMAIVVTPSTSANAATISHSIGDAPSSVNLTTDGTQDWILVNFNNSNDTFETHNSKSGGSGITLGTGFGTDIGTAIAEIGVRGPTYTYTDGTSPSTEAPSKRDVAQGDTDDFDDILNSYTMTFDVITPGVEHTVNVYLTTGRARWTDISAGWTHADPTSLSTLSQDLNEVYALSFTPDTFADDVTVTFTAAATESTTNDYRLGFTAAALSVATPEPSPEPSALILAVVGVMGLMGMWRRRRNRG